MKLPTSSSILLATLAISSSSSSLAAPAWESTEAGLSISSSSHDVFDPSANPTPHGSAHAVQSQSAPKDKTEAMAARSDNVICTSDVSKQLTTIQPLLESLLSKPQAIAGADVAKLQAVIETLTQILSCVPALSSIKNDVAPPALYVAPSTVNDAPRSSVASPSAPTPQSPVMPSNPPNTPSLSHPR